MNTLKYIEALQQAALDLEHQKRLHRYGADCATVDANDSKKFGFAVMFDENKAVEIIPIAPMEATLRGANEESEEFGGPIFVAVGPEHKNLTNPVHIEGPNHKQPPERKTPPANDAALAAKLKQATFDARRWSREQLARNERIAAQMKSISEKQWNRSA